MFKELKEHLNKGDTVTVVITEAEGNMVVSVKPSNRLKGILPIQLTGTADELDEGFVEALKTPLRKVGEKLGINTKPFDDSLEEAEVVTEKADKSKSKSTSKATIKAKPEEKKTETKSTTKPTEDKGTTKPEAGKKKANEEDESPFVGGDGNVPDPTIELFGQVDLHVGRKDYTSAATALEKARKETKDKDIIKKIDDKLYNVRLEKQRAMLAEDEEADEADEIPIPPKAAAAQPAPKQEEPATVSDEVKDPDDF